MADPNLEVCPDYALPEFEDARLIFTVDGKTEAKAIALLESLWALSNTRNIENRQRQQETDAKAERNRIALAEQEAEQQRALRDEEEADAKKEERKKYKNKFTPIPDRPLPDTALILLPQHALTKLRKGEYVPLYLFTNKVIRETEEEGSGDEDLLTSASVKAKKHKVKDESLSWEEFGQANYRMLNAMQQQEWPEDRLKMVRDFWIAIKTHSWRHDPSEYRQRALLVYQGRIRKDWHKTLGTTDAFRLLPIHAGRLNDYHQELLDNAYVTTMEAIRAATHIHLPLEPAALDERAVQTNPLPLAQPFQTPHVPTFQRSRGRDTAKASTLLPPQLDSHPSTPQHTSLLKHTPKCPTPYAPCASGGTNTRCRPSSAQPKAHVST